MGLTDRLKDVTKKAEEKAAAHSEQIRQAAQKAGETADRHTGGKYSDRIQQAGAKVDALVDGLEGPAGADPGEAAAQAPDAPPAPDQPA